jgi:hypothetical protein
MKKNPNLARETTKHITFTSHFSKTDDRIYDNGLYQSVFLNEEIHRTNHGERSSPFSDRDMSIVINPETVIKYMTLRNLQPYGV